MIISTESTISYKINGNLKIMTNSNLVKIIIVKPIINIIKCNNLNCKNIEIENRTGIEIKNVSIIDKRNNYNKFIKVINNNEYVSLSYELINKTSSLITSSEIIINNVIYRFHV